MLLKALQQVLLAGSRVTSHHVSESFVTSDKCFDLQRLLVALNRAFGHATSKTGSNINRCAVVRKSITAKDAKIRKTVTLNATSREFSSNYQSIVYHGHYLKLCGSRCKTKQGTENMGSKHLIISI